jgi:hypothetical protein
VLTAPFGFKKFYDVYGKNWRVSPKQSFLSVCGGTPTALIWGKILKL